MAAGIPAEAAGIPARAAGSLLTLSLPALAVALWRLLELLCVVPPLLISHDQSPPNVRLANY